MSYRFHRIGSSDLPLHRDQIEALIRGFRGDRLYVSITSARRTVKEAAIVPPLWLRELEGWSAEAAPGTYTVGISEEEPFDLKQPQRIAFGMTVEQTYEPRTESPAELLPRSPEPVPPVDLHALAQRVADLEELVAAGRGRVPELIRMSDVKPSRVIFRWPDSYGGTISKRTLDELLWPGIIHGALTVTVGDRKVDVPWDENNHPRFSESVVEVAENLLGTGVYSVSVARSGTTVLRFDAVVHPFEARNQGAS